MFLALLLVTFAIALIISFVVVRLFEQPIASILARIIPEEMSSAWLRYIKFAIYVMGVSGGVNIWYLDRYITPSESGTAPLVLNTNRWILEIYRTALQTLQSIAGTLLVFFLFALIAYVIVRAFELRKPGQAERERERTTDGARQETV
ncbi:MAG: hypothetical protein M5U01_41405 [Ardenticatenaceae bacterium]|nr:hypothetical protein [Ardenticatenaceae bacterium]